jgi:hypothetical protein
MIKRRQPAKAAQYREEAKVVQSDVRAARADAAMERARTAGDINATIAQVNTTDIRIAASVEAMKATRLANHFTDKVRALMEGSLTHG